MSVYVGIDVHRKRSQVAVVTGDGQVQLNRNVVNGQEPILKLIGGLPAGTPVAFEAAYGWGWLVELLEDYGFDPHLVYPLRCKAIASARLKNDKVDAAILAQPRAHLQTGLGVAALGSEPGGADRQALPGIRSRLRRHRQAPREEDRYHRDRPQAAHACLPPARCRAGRRDSQHDETTGQRSLTPRCSRRPGRSPNPGRARSCGMSRPPGRSIF